MTSLCQSSQSKNGAHNEEWHSERSGVITYVCKYCGEVTKEQYIDCGSGY